MRTLSYFARMAVTLGFAGGLLTAMLWNAPGRDLDMDSWGHVAAVDGGTVARPWNTYSGFAVWYGRELLRGGGGISTGYGEPVNVLIAERAPVTLAHAGYGFGLAWALSLLAGVGSHFQRRVGDAALHAGSLLLALPSAVVVLALALSGAPPWAGLAVCVWPKTFSYWETVLRTARGRNHVLAMLAQGAGPWRIQWSAIWIPSLRQFFGLLAVSVPLLLGALIPVEVLCDSPGLGQLAWKAVSGRDLPLLTTLTLLFTAVTCGMSLLAESLSPEAG